MPSQFIRKLFRFFPLLIGINLIIIALCFNQRLSLFISTLFLGLMVYVTFAGLTLWFQKPGLDISSSALCILLMSLAYLLYLLTGEYLIEKISQSVGSLNHFLSMQTLKLIGLLILSNLLIGLWTGTKLRGKTYHRG